MAGFKYTWDRISTPILKSYLKKKYIMTIQEFDTKKIFREDNVNKAIAYVDKNSEKKRLILRGYDPKTKENVWTYDVDEYELSSDIPAMRM